MINFTTNPITEIVYDLDFADYQKREGINQSALGRFDYDSGGCPEAYRYEALHGRRDDDELSEAVTLGDQAHNYTLQPHIFADRFVVCDLDKQEELFALALAQKSKAKGFSRALATYKSWEAEQIALGKSVVSPERMRQLSDMREALLKRPEILEAGVFDEGTRFEVSVFAPFECHAGILQQKGRPDIVPADGDALLDYKTCRSASPKAFARAVADYGYARQASVYLDLMRLNGRDVSRFGFVAQETKPPYLAAVHWLPEEWIRHARILCRKTLFDLAECVRLNHWPGFESGILMPPNFLLAEIEALAA